jgi:hypothetical protein
LAAVRENATKQPPNISDPSKAMVNKKEKAKKESRQITIPSLLICCISLIHRCCRPHKVASWSQNPIELQEEKATCWGKKQANTSISIEKLLHAYDIPQLS